MSAIKLHVIKPSVNNMTARVFIRAAKLDFTEDDVFGKTRTDDNHTCVACHASSAVGIPISTASPSMRTGCVFNC